jgi:hypothetical protein
VVANFCLAGCEQISILQHVIGQFDSDIFISPGPWTGGIGEFINFYYYGVGNVTWGSNQFSMFLFFCFVYPVLFCSKLCCAPVVYCSLCVSCWQVLLMPKITADDYVTLSLCAPEGDTRTIYITCFPYEPLDMELSVTSNGNHNPKPFHFIAHNLTC